MKIKESATWTIRKGDCSIDLSLHNVFGLLFQMSTITNLIDCDESSERLEDWLDGFDVSVSGDAVQITLLTEAAEEAKQELPLPADTVASFGPPKVCDDNDDEWLGPLTNVEITCYRCCSHDECGTSNVPISGSLAKQFDFSRKWRKVIAPLLDDPEVVKALTFGMKLFHPSYSEGDPPWLMGRGPLNGQRALEGCLSWYQPWGRCHWIAVFCWMLGRKLFPELHWGFVAGELHTIVIGFDDNWLQPVRIFDILHFGENTAQESLDLAMRRHWTFYGCLKGYILSFSDVPNSVLEEFVGPDTVLESYFNEGRCEAPRI